MPRCTEETPMPPSSDKTEKSTWTHPDAEIVYEGSLYDLFECPHCGEEMKASK